MAKHFKAGEGALFAQPGGPNTPLWYLGCHLLGDIDHPQGDIELIFCRDPSAVNRFMVVDSMEGTPGAPTTSITTDVTDEFDPLETLDCPFPLYINMVASGRPDNFGNATRTFILTGARITSRGLSNLVARQPDDQGRSEQTFDIAGESLLRTGRYTVARQTVPIGNDIIDITFCNDPTCLTADTPYRQACEIGYAVAAHLTGSAADVAAVLKTMNGSTWVQADADPFAAGEDISAVVCFDLGGGNVRVIVARGTTDAGEPAEIAYSDDGGDTWTAVDVGAVVGAFIPGPNALFVYDSVNTWAGTDDGYIYYSDDGGLSWDAQESASIHTGSWNAIDFVTADIGWAGGDANVIARSVDGGMSWEAIVGPVGQGAANVTAVDALDRYRAWVGFSDGTLWYTRDGGENWDEKSFSGSGVGAVRQISFYNELIGMLLRNDGAGAGYVLATKNGGTTWESVAMPTNSGVNGGTWCNERLFYVAGDLQGATGLITRASVAGI